MATSCLPSATGLPSLSRRREPRIDVSDTVRIRPASAGAPEVLAVHDLSFRGFSIDTPRPVPLRVRAAFRLEASGERPVTAIAIAVHCHELAGAGGRWRSGWEFPEQAGLEAAIERLLDRAVGILVIE